MSLGLKHLWFWTGLIFVKQENQSIFFLNSIKTSIADLQGELFVRQEANPVVQSEY